MKAKNEMEEKKMLKCEICGCKFNALIEKHYISRDERQVGLAALSGGPENTEYDTFDCPQCGCQHIVQERKRTVNKDNGKA